MHQSVPESPANQVPVRVTRIKADGSNYYLFPTYSLTPTPKLEYLSVSLFLPSCFLQGKRNDSSSRTPLACPRGTIPAPVANTPRAWG